MKPSARAARREDDLRRLVLPKIEEIHGLRPKIASALFVVSQYWCDNANDEVHGVIVFSPRAEPTWPHRCIRPHQPNEDFCTRCYRISDYFSLPYEEAAFRAWEAFCREDARQDDPVGDAYLPYALYRRQVDGSWERTVVAPPVRGWLELDPAAEIAEEDPTLDSVYLAPDSIGVRAVVADALLERGDPRGELIVRQLRNAPSAELLAAHERAWLGPLASVVPFGGATFTNGFAEDVSVYFDEDVDYGHVLSASEWLTVRRLRFLPGSKQHLSTSMCHVRRVGPLEDDMVLSLDRTRWAFERMQIRMSDPYVPELLTDLVRSGALPHLRELVVHGDGATPENLAPLVDLGVRSIDVAQPEPSGEGERRAFEPDLARRWLTVLGDQPVRLAFGSLGVRGEPAGPWAHLRFEGRTLVRETSWHGWDTRVTEDDLVRAIDALER